MSGRIGIGDLRQVIREALAEIYGVTPGTSPYGGTSIRDTSVAAAISAVLDTQWRPFFEVSVESSGATTFTVEGSIDGIVYVPGFDIVLAGPGADSEGGFNAFRYIRVSSADALNHTVTITATR